MDITKKKIDNRAPEFLGNKKKLLLPPARTGFRVDPSAELAVYRVFLWRAFFFVFFLVTGSRSLWFCAKAAGRTDVFVATILLLAGTELIRVYETNSVV